MKNNKILTDLHRILETQDFKNEEEMNTFLQKFEGQVIPSFPEETLSNEEKAEDLVYQAYNLSTAKGKKLVKQSLELDPNCIMAYQYLGQQENNIKNAIKYFTKGQEIGAKVFGGPFEKEHKGHFWLIHETRPYMSCILGLADCYFYLDDTHKAIELAEYLLDLNPNDNQGIRYNLTTYLMAAAEYTKLNKHFKAHDNDGGIVILYNKALSAYTQKKSELLARSLLIEAIDHNPKVVQLLSLKKSLTTSASTYASGSEEEAIYYLQHNMFLWQKEGAIDWAKSVYDEYGN